MKKALALIPLFYSTFQDVAQSPVGLNQLEDIPGKFIEIPALLLLISVIAGFIINVVRLFFDYRLKNKIIDKGVPEEIVAHVLRPSAKDTKKLSFKWFSVLASIGMGLIIINLSRPFGIHSIIIMTFSVAAGFLAYYYFETQLDKNNSL
jgi:hypothetical protein